MWLRETETKTKTKTRAWGGHRRCKCAPRERRATASPRRHQRWLHHRQQHDDGTTAASKWLTISHLVQEAVLLSHIAGTPVCLVNSSSPMIFVRYKSVGPRSRASFSSTPTFARVTPTAPWRLKIRYPQSRKICI